MAGLKLDGAGQVKMATLDAAMHVAMSLNAQAERMAVAVKGNAKGTQNYVSAYKRAAVPLVGQLKGQFGMIAEIVANSILLVSRPGGGDVARVRVMREGVAQLKVQLEIAISHVKAKHVKHDDEPDGSPASSP